jgi:hypothetical protein
MWERCLAAIPKIAAGGRSYTSACTVMSKRAQ